MWKTDHFILKDWSQHDGKVDGSAIMTQISFQHSILSTSGISMSSLKKRQYKNDSSLNNNLK